MLGSSLLLVTGRLQRSPEGIVHVVADRLDDRSALMARITEVTACTAHDGTAAKPGSPPPGTCLSPVQGLPLTGKSPSETAVAGRRRSLVAARLSPGISTRRWWSACYLTNRCGGGSFVVDRRPPETLRVLPIREEKRHAAVSSGLRALGPLAALCAAVAGCASTAPPTVQYNGINYPNYSTADFNWEQRTVPRPTISTKQVIPGYEDKLVVTVDEPKAKACLASKGWQPN